MATARASPWAAGEVARGEFSGRRGARHGGQAEAVREAADLVLDAWGGKADQEERHQKKVRESVDSLLGSVSESDRILLMLKEVEGLSLKELEKIYKVNENALKVRLFRARQRVLKAFGASEKK